MQHALDVSLSYPPHSLAPLAIPSQYLAVAGPSESSSVHTSSDLSPGLPLSNFAPPTVPWQQPQAELEPHVVGRRNQNQARFVHKLYAMLEDVSIAHLIAWAPRGEVFSVTKPTEFSRVALPRYFLHSNWQSWIRQLNMYGFTKARDFGSSYERVLSSGAQAPEGSFTPSPGHDGQAAWDFMHENFRRGRSDLLQQIKRRSAKASTKREETPAVAPSQSSNATLSSNGSVSPSLSGAFLETMEGPSTAVNGYSRPRSRTTSGYTPTSVQPIAPTKPITSWTAYRSDVPSPQPQPQQPPAMVNEDRVASLEQSVRVLTAALVDATAETERLREQSFALFRMVADVLPMLIEPAAQAHPHVNIALQKRYSVDLIRETVSKLDGNAKAREAARSSFSAPAPPPFPQTTPAPHLADFLPPTPQSAQDAYAPNPYADTSAYNPWQAYTPYTAMPVDPPQEPLHLPPISSIVARPPLLDVQSHNPKRGLQCRQRDPPEGEEEDEEAVARWRAEREAAEGDHYSSGRPKRRKGAG